MAKVGSVAGEITRAAVCGSLVLAFTLRAAEDFSRTQGLVVRTWGTEAGLPQNTVSAIVQTREGYLWLATREGLARFDGLRFTVFGLREGLESVAVQTLFEDRQGILWIGTDGGGLSRLVAGRIETVPLPPLGAGGDSINALAEDAQGRLWVGTRAGLVVWDRDRFVPVPALAELSRTSIYALFQGRDGTMWIATAVAGLFEFRNDRLTKCENPPGSARIAAYCLLEDQQGRLWAGIGNGMVLCRLNGQWRIYTQEDGVPYAYATCLTEAADGTIWLGSVDEGIHRLRGERFVAVSSEPVRLSNAIRALRFDREGNLWVGTRTSGLSRLNERKLIAVGAAQGLTNDFTRSVAETTDGTLWVGTTGGGLYHGGVNGFEPFGTGGVFRFYSVVESVLAARDGSLWWGGARALLRWQDGELAGCYTNLPWIREALVTALCEDQREGLWIGTSLGRLVHFDGRQFVEFPRGVARGPVTALALQPDGDLWVGSLAGGLKRVRADSEVVDSVTNGLLSAAIRTLYLEADGTLWIGTAGGGLSRWRDGEVANFTSKQGLGADTISQIVEDEEGNLWLGCSRGILRVSKHHLNELAAGQRAFVHPRSFGLSDGMPVEECSSGFHPAGLKLRSGWLCFSTVRGLVFINPSAQETDLPPPAMLLEETVVDGQTRYPEIIGGSGNGGASRLHLRIPPGRRDVEINYTGLNFASPEKVRFRYRLDRYDGDWVEAGGRRTAYYSRLPPGDFTFRVMACNADTVWSPETTLAITVQPYLWQTSWFLALAVLAGIASFAGLLRFIERRKYRQRLVLLETRHAVERERLRISQDMHDHIGGMLTQVSQLSDLGQAAAAPADSHGHFVRIGTQARAAVQSLDEIVWATNPKNDNLPRFADYVSRYADEFFENSSVRCWQEMPPGLPHLPLRADLRHNVFLALKEALNNVLKHSGATQVWLRLTLDEESVRLEVEDNGRGFNPHQPAPGGNGVENMKSRLAECGGRTELLSEPGRGTKVRLQFPRPFASEPGS
ncbi:MAG: ATP-binding protein [Verrucomicrobiae bacterium]|nr:ATP-binding protein [Verrucomicrobiae bacterium]